MADDRKDKPATESSATGNTPPPSAIPNRDRRREPPTIDAKPGEVKELSGAGATPAASATASETKADEPKAGAPADKPTVTAEATAKAQSPDTAKSAPKPAAPVPSPAKRSGGLVAGLLGGVAGAAVALAGGYALVSPRLLSQQQVEALAATASGKTATEINASLAAVQKKTGEDTARQSAALDELARRIAATEALAKKLPGDIEAVRAAAAKAGSPAPAPTVDLAPIEAGLGDLEKRIAEIEKALSAPKTPTRASDPDVKPPEGPATAAPAAPNLPSPALMADVSALAERLRALEVRPAPRMPDLAPLQARLQQLEQRLAPLVEKLGPIEAALAQGRDAAGSQTKSLEAQRERSDAAALAVVARGLVEAIATGAPYANLLKAAQALGADANAVKSLEPFAAKGLPSPASLATQFSPIATALIDGDARPDPNASLTEKLAASAGKLVRVRPADDTTEETPAALATRINVALRGQKFEEALALYAKLPEPARARAKAWADAVGARVEAARAGDIISNAALARLARP